MPFSLRRAGGRLRGLVSAKPKLARAMRVVTRINEKEMSIIEDELKILPSIVKDAGSVYNDISKFTNIAEGIARVEAKRMQRAMLGRRITSGMAKGALHLLESGIDPTAHAAAKDGILTAKQVSAIAQEEIESGIQKLAKSKQLGELALDVNKKATVLYYRCDYLLRAAKKLGLEVKTGLTITKDIEGAIGKEFPGLQRAWDPKEIPAK